MRSGERTSAGGPSATSRPSSSNARRPKKWDASGKSCHSQQLASWLKDQGWTVRHLREPGSTATGEALRQLLLDPRTGALAPLTEALLFSAARQEMLRDEVAPALAAGEFVLVERCYLSTLVYQGLCGSLSIDLLTQVTGAVHGDLWPERIFVLDVDETTRRERAQGAGKADVLAGESDSAAQRGDGLARFLGGIQCFHEQLMRLGIGLLQLESLAQLVCRQLWLVTLEQRDKLWTVRLRKPGKRRRRRRKPAPPPILTAKQPTPTPQPKTQSTPQPRTQPAAKGLGKARGRALRDRVERAVERADALRRQLEKLTGTQRLEGQAESVVPPEMAAMILSPPPLPQGPDEAPRPSQATASDDAHLGLN